MTLVRRSARVPFSAEQMYALVNDIESYPEFLPWCSDARIHSRKGNQLTATVALSARGIEQSFTTRNRMQPGRRIDVHLLEGPFRRLDGFWELEPAADGTCTVKLEMEFEFKNRVLQLALGKLFHHIVDSLVDAFTERARRVYRPG